MANFLRFFFLVLPIGFYSCNPVLYTNTSQNVSFLKKKGEISLSANYTITSTKPLIPQADGFSFNGSAAVTDHFAVHGSYNWLKAKDSYVKYRGNYGELGLGCISIFEEKGPEIFEVFTGIGYLNLKSQEDYPYASDVIKGDYLKPYIQPTIGFSRDDQYFAFTPRVAYVHNLSYERSPLDSVETAEIARFYSKDRLLFEPGVTIQVGHKKTRVRLQYVYSTFNFNSEYLFKPVNNHFISIGLTYMITR